MADNDANAKLATAPEISDVSAQVDGSDVTFGARIHGSDHLGVDNLTRAWLTYTFGEDGDCSCWQSIELARSDTDDSIWTALLDIGAANANDLRFIVQATNSAALVGTSDNGAAFHSLASTAAGTPAPTSLDLGSVPSSGAYGSTINVSATLTEGASALSGKTVFFRVGSAIESGVTNGSGVASASLPLLTTPGAQQIVATFTGNRRRPEAATRLRSR